MAKTIEQLQGRNMQKWIQTKLAAHTYTLTLKKIGVTSDGCSPALFLAPFDPFAVILWVCGMLLYGDG
jgi:hypothetical protein